MINVPDKIYLQIGEETPDDTDFNQISEVTWCKEKIFENDVEYIRADIYYNAIRNNTISNSVSK
ncbi:MAG: hypothetical protein QXU40_01365 [Candidatus Pacearchaeota archaeon]